MYEPVALLGRQALDYLRDVVREHEAEARAPFRHTRKASHAFFCGEAVRVFRVRYHAARFVGGAQVRVDVAPVRGVVALAVDADDGAGFHRPWSSGQPTVPYEQICPPIEPTIVLHLHRIGRSLSQRRPSSRLESKATPYSLHHSARSSSSPNSRIEVL